MEGISRQPNNPVLMEAELVSLTHEIHSLFVASHPGKSR